MHVRLRKGSAISKASDAMPPIPIQKGTTCSVSVHGESLQEIEKILVAFGEKGKVTLPRLVVFCDGRFGTITGHIGINWMFNIEKAKE